MARALLLALLVVCERAASYVPLTHGSRWCEPGTSPSSACATDGRRQHSIRGRGCVMAGDDMDVVEAALAAARAVKGKEDDGSEFTDEPMDEDGVRQPPPYPEGLHDPAKADREGPFWSSLGEPDSSTGVRPAYLRRDDWHISSTYTAEQRAAVEAEEAAYIESVRIETPEEDEEEEEEEDWSAENIAIRREYMQLEEDNGGARAQASELPMPNSWQDYQELQEQIASLTSADWISSSDRDVAAEHEQNLADFYLQFKDIISYGWKLENSPYVENAVKFVGAHKK